MNNHDTLHKYNVYVLLKYIFGLSFILIIITIFENAYHFRNKAAISYIEVFSFLLCGSVFLFAKRRITVIHFDKQNNSVSITEFFLFRTTTTTINCKNISLSYKREALSIRGKSLVFRICINNTPKYKIMSDMDGWTDDMLFDLIETFKYFNSEIKISYD